MEALTDNPIAHVNDDAYGFAPYAEILAGMIRDTSKLPFCMGIYGPWGTGKSSLMNLIEADLRRTDPSCKSIWFNPWKYHRREELWSALIRSILTKVKDEGHGQAKEIAGRMLRMSAWSLLKRATGALSAGVITGDDLENLKNALAETEEEYQKHINEFEDDFAKLVDAFTQRGKLVLFIDDLDRCLPENAITVLESLKLFIGHARCVFVLGMDKTVVEIGIQKLYGDQVGLSGRDYLDKIVQVPFYIPPVPFNRLRDSLSVVKTEQYSPMIWAVLEHGLGGNPRKTKRFVNTFYLLRRVLAAPDIAQVTYAGDDSELPRIPREQQDYFLAKILVMQLVFPGFYEIMLAQPDAWRTFEDLVIKGAPDQMKAALTDYPEFKPFAENAAFRKFMSATTSTPTNGLPQAPGAPVIAHLMRAVNLVSDTSRSSRSEARPRARVVK